MGWRDSAGMRLGPRSWVGQLLFFIVACIIVLMAVQAFRPPVATTRTNPDHEASVVLGAPSVPARVPLGDDEFSAPPPLDVQNSPRDREPKPTPTVPDLRAIRDHTLGVRFDEADSFFDLLQNARRTTPDELDDQVRFDVQYINLMTDPERYRGKVVSVAGELRQWNSFPAARNRYGLQTLYEAWIVTPDSSPHAYRVVTTQLGEDIPREKSARLPVQVTGYFLKQEGYVAPAGVEVAPVILGAVIHRDETVFHPAGMSTFPPWMLGLIVAGGLILTATMVSMALSERHSLRLRPWPHTLSVETLTALAATPPFSIHAVLRELEEADRVRQFETIRRPVATTVVKPPHSPLPKPRSLRDVELPTPTPPTRQFRAGWKRTWIEEGHPPSDS